MRSLSVIFDSGSVWGDINTEMIDESASLAALEKVVVAGLRALDSNVDLVVAIVDRWPNARTVIDDGDGSSIEEKAFDYIVQIAWERWDWITVKPEIMISKLRDYGAPDGKARAVVANIVRGRASSQMKQP